MKIMLDNLDTLSCKLPIVQEMKLEKGPTYQIERITQETSWLYCLNQRQKYRNSIPTGMTRLSAINFSVSAYKLHGKRRSKVKASILKSSKPKLG